MRKFHQYLYYNNKHKIRIPPRPCNILYKCNSAVFYPVKFGWLDQDEKKNHLMVNFQWAKFIWLFCWFVGLFVAKFIWVFCFVDPEKILWEASDIDLYVFH